MSFVYLEPCHPVLLVDNFPQPVNEKRIIHEIPVAYKRYLLGNVPVPIYKQIPFAR
jgi:hypothetical protein